MQRAKQPPAGSIDHIGLDQPEVREVIGEVVDEHRQQRDAAGKVYQSEAEARARQRRSGWSWSGSWPRLHHGGGS